MCACCSGEKVEFDAIEGPLRAVDGLAATKWLMQWEINSPEMNPRLLLKFKTEVTVLGYTLTSADDVEARDPTAW